MATTTTAAAALSMKLLIDRKAKRVLFAEAGKDVVDFLFSLLALPVATAVKLVGTEAVVGSVGNLYSSVENLDSTYVVKAGGKDALLRPTVISPAASSSNGSLLRLPAAAPPPSGAAQPKSYFKCSNNYSSGFYSTSSSCSTYVTDASGVICPSCRNQMNAALKYVAPSSEQQQAAEKSSAAGGAAKGFVQGIVTYTVLDNLTVTPMSAISSITLLNTFAVKDIGDLQEKTVHLGYDEGLAILKASLESKTVLTDVFLGNKKKARRA